MRKHRFIECSDGTKAYVGDKVQVQRCGQTLEGTIEDIYSDLRYYKLRCGELIYHCLSGIGNLYLIERKKK